MAKTTIVLHSGDLDKMYSALIIGNGALAMGMDCSIYFTFWGLQRLRKGKLSGGPLSKMNMLGLGRLFMKRKMGGANVASLERLMKDYKELGGSSPWSNRDSQKSKCVWSGCRNHRCCRKVGTPSDNRASCLFGPATQKYLDRL